MYGMGIAGKLTTQLTLLTPASKCMTLWSHLFPNTITRGSERPPSFLRYHFDLMPNAHQQPCPLALHRKFSESLITHHNYTSSALPFPPSFMPCLSPLPSEAVQHVHPSSGFSSTSCRLTGNTFAIHSLLSWRCRIINQYLPWAIFSGGHSDQLSQTILIPSSSALFRPIYPRCVCKHGPHYFPSLINLLASNLEWLDDTMPSESTLPTGLSP
ncbi:hypothetical protein F5141DRAFT_1080713 [Pisolithus sp. B1]|nr:hypothetical protein F5141DRAFT_1080713 [Pisolithus sp. B1]